jgi:hypothetical protein
MFVLPRSPLPEPLAKESPRQARKDVDVEARFADEEPVTLSDPVFSQPVHEFDADAEIEWLDEPPVEEETADAPGEAVDDAAKQGEVARDEVSAPQRPKPKKEPAAKARPRPASAARAERPASVASAEKAAPVAPLQERLAGWAYRRRNPLIFLAVGLIVISTVGYRVARSRFQELPRIAEIGREQGLAALDAGQFDTAQQLLSDAKRAVVALHDAVDGAAEIRQGADEAAIITSLSPDSLEAILADASADQEWGQRFRTLYKGRGIILEAEFTAVPDAGGSGPFELNYRIIPTKGPPDRFGSIDLTGFRLFEGSGHQVGDRVVFGARLDSCALVVGTREWRVTLEPESGIYMKHPNALEALGWPNRDQVKEDDPQ